MQSLQNLKFKWWRLRNHDRIMAAKEIQASAPHALGLLLLFRFLTLFHDLAQLAGMLSVKRLEHGLPQGCGLRIHNDHSSPCDRLKQDPLDSYYGDQTCCKCDFEDAAPHVRNRTRRQKKINRQIRILTGRCPHAATALLYDLPLVTRNVSDFMHVVGLKLVNPFAPET